MIKSLKDARLTDGLPRILSEQDWVQALSGAWGKAHEQTISYAENSQIYTAIDEMGDDLLDILALQLNAPYYNQDMDIETKRGIIKRTLKWYMKAGTPWAVEDMIKTIFGEGKVVEWFDFDEGEQTPGYFDIVTSGQLTPDAIAQFTKIIERVKNVRSHIRRILVERSVKMHEYAAAAIISSPHDKITNSPQRSRAVNKTLYSGMAVISHPKVTITNTKTLQAQIQGTPKGGMAVMSSPKVGVLNAGQS